MASVGRFVQTADPAVTALESPPLPTETRLWRQSPDCQSESDSNRVSGSVLDSVKSNGGPKHASTARLHASQDLPTSVTRFLCLSSSSNSAAAKDLRRQLLVVRDCCVALGNKVKGSELLLLGGSQLSRKVEAMADFNSCLGVIFAASLTFTGETEGVAKDTLCSVVEMLKSAQESGDEKVFRAAVVKIVNRILLCTPLRPPARNAAKETARKSAGKQEQHAEQEPKLEDECLDFLTVEDGVPVLLECVWKRWLRYFEDGYVRYVKKLMAEERQALEAAAAAAAADDYNGEEAQYVDGVSATTTQTISTVPLFTTCQDYWKSPASAYAQFCYILLAIFFVRTKDFSLNYLARVTKLVQYFTYQLEFEDGEPIAVRTDTDAEEDSAQSEDEDDDRTPPQQEGPRKEKQVHSLPMPEYDKAVTQRRFRMSRRSSSQGLVPTVVSFKKAEKPRRHCHKCFFTDALPGDLRPSVEAVRQEEAEAAARDSEEHSHLPVVRRSANLDLSEHSISPQREREQLDACDASMESVQGV
ncbi:hypothetical protein LMJF_12_1200 [Leishmania major strain Friedlin]|uniref:Uncharacterized protein n=1 Tax=Leishmania major TaxID=5664 RepID=Q4QGG9_LEIMA|nr:hypothetical protein LMJF_12_1200 [Leishmania major strain Friedlin]CAG9570520.1 hypothetical_protein_-_conserved [Leishmania major strain Friedlin]CAJ03060.1 hypothetical protein LMJF_12_1200 [Leishmania major strain Friedlin]|eukprot:XP_001681729.1 hypothetical protein LMJF_12_1200 [Leishmania major strain Friedlin]